MPGAACRRVVKPGTIIQGIRDVKKDDLSDFNCAAFLSIPVCNRG